MEKFSRSFADCNGNRRSVVWWRIRGTRPGPVLSIVAGQHGMEHVGPGLLPEFAGEMERQPFAGELRLVCNANPFALLMDYEFYPENEDLSKINQKIDAAVSEQNALNELIKDKKEDELSTEEKDKREETSKKLDDLRRQRTDRLGELGKENKLVKQLIDLALLANGMLKGEELTRFIRRSVDLIGTNK